MARRKPEDCPICENGEGEIPTWIALFPGPWLNKPWTCYYCGARYIRRSLEGEAS